MLFFKLMKVLQELKIFIKTSTPFFNKTAYKNNLLDVIKC